MKKSPEQFSSNQFDLNQEEYQRAFTNIKEKRIKRFIDGARLLPQEDAMRLLVPFRNNSMPEYLSEDPESRKKNKEIYEARQEKYKDVIKKIADTKDDQKAREILEDLEKDFEPAPIEIFEEVNSKK